MADSTMSNFSDPTPSSAPGSADDRPSHDRELPVAATEADRASASHASTPRAERAEGEAHDSAGSDGGSAKDESASAEPLTEDQVKLALRRVKDPELNLNILDLGLVYGIRVDGNAVAIDMTLTSPGCPSGPEIMTDAERHLRALPGVGEVSVNLVWSPFWSPDRIEPRVRAYMGF